MIIKPPFVENFCQVCNEVARDVTLSARAKGIYYYLATLPQHWRLSKTECQKHFTEGINAFTTAFNELENTGYVIKERKKNDKNCFVGWEYQVLWHKIPDPMETLKSGNRPVGNPPLVKTKEVNTDLVKTKETNTKTITTTKTTKSVSEKKQDLPTSLEIKKWWNDIAQRNNLSTITTMTKQRGDKCKTRKLNHKTMETITDHLDNLDDFYKDKSWINFDQIFKNETTYTNFIECKYRKKRVNITKQSTTMTTTEVEAQPRSPFAMF